MKKKSIICLSTFCMVFALTGCGSSIPEMTEEQEQIVAEYAANLLLKYDKNYEVKVVDTTAYHMEEERKAEEARKAEEEAAKAATAEKETTENAQENSDGSEVPEQTATSIEEFYQLADVQIQYSGYGIYDSYPENTENSELFFAVGSTDGNKLLVLNFDVTNVSGKETELNMMDVNAQFKISVNGGNNQNALFTLLPEDLESYRGTLGIDETVKAVLVVEIPIGESEAVDTITLTAKGADGNAQFVLQ